MDRFPINPRRVAMLAGFFVLVFMVMDFNSRLEELDRLKKQARLIEVQATQAIQTQAGLETQVAYATSDQAVQDWARSEGHFIQPGDQPVVPIEQPGPLPVQTEEPTATPTPQPNWSVWWDLFFGE